MYESTFSFKGVEGALSCDLRVVDKNGAVIFYQRLAQVDRIDRKYSVTTNISTR